MGSKKVNLYEIEGHDTHCDFVIVPDASDDQLIIAEARRDHNEAIAFVEVRNDKGEILHLDADFSGRPLLEMARQVLDSTISYRPIDEYSSHNEDIKKELLWR